MLKSIKETELENRIISLLQEQEYLYTSGSELKRESPRQVLLLEDLGKFLQSKHPELIKFDIRQIADDLELQLSNKNLYESNRDFIQDILIDGKIHERDSDGETFPIKFIDFQDPGNNIFRVVNQLTVQEYETQIADLVIYINGIPFVVWELKSPSNQHISWEEAHAQLQSYTNNIPSLFKYNAFSVLCDEVNVKLGSAWGSLAHFYEWKKIDDSTPPETHNLLETTIKGLFKKERLIKVIEDFICFSDSEPKRKVICRYPQFFGATKLLKNIEKNLRPDGGGKGGVYYGATGCGKSYIMLFLSRLLMRSKDLKRPSILLITDRSELNDQLAKLFETHSNYLGVGQTNVKKVKSRADLKELFKSFYTGTIFLTTIQKFAEDNELLSDRNNIICISDEAHRSQTNFEQQYKHHLDEITQEDIVTFSVPFAKRVHDSLPNATYVGFTATPKPETEDVFGDIVDQYSMADSKRDNFTVEINTEARILRMEINERIARLMDDKYAQLKIQGVTDKQIQSSQKEFLSMKTLIEHPVRIADVAEDIVKHYEKRIEEGSTVKGKAMIVANGRLVGYQFYKEFERLRPEWFKESEAQREYKKVHLVMTRSDKDLKKGDDTTRQDMERMHELIGDLDFQKRLAEQFKDADSIFKIAIVSDKWSTGFDVPELDTMYLDRILTDHNLIQTISRVNRKFPNKEHGLVVHYLPIQRELAEAIKKYGGEGSQSKRSGEIREVVISVKDKLELLNELFYGFDKSPFFEVGGKNRFRCIWAAVQWVESRSQEFENKFISRYLAFRTEYMKCSASELLSEEIRNESMFYRTLWAVYMKYTKKEMEESETALGIKIKELFDQVFLVDDPKVIFLGSIQVSILTEEDLMKIASSGNVHEVTKRLITTLENANKEFTKINSRKGLIFSEKLRKLKDKYNSLESDVRRVKEREREVKQSDEELEWEVQNEVARQTAEIRDELLELGREYIQANETYKNLGLSRLETVFFEILLETREQFGLDYPESKLIELSREIKTIVIEKSRQIDWWKKVSVKAQIGMEMTLLLTKHGYTRKSGKIVEGLQDEVIRRSIEFKKHYENEWN